MNLARGKLLWMGFLAAWLTACGRREAPKPELIEQAFGITNLPSTIQSAQPEPGFQAGSQAANPGETAQTLRLAGFAAGSIRGHNYAAAVTNLAALQEQPALTPPQRIAVQHAMEAVQTELALKVQRGDAEAKREADRLRETVRH